MNLLQSAVRHDVIDNLVYMRIVQLLSRDRIDRHIRFVFLDSCRVIPRDPFVNFISTCGIFLCFLIVCIILLDPFDVGMCDL